MPSSITLGSRVCATIGPFLDQIGSQAPQQNGSTCERPQKRVRRSRSKLYGTVIESVADSLWKVWWEGYQVTANHKSTNLRLPQGSRQSVIEIDRINEIKATLQRQSGSQHIGSHQAMLDYAASLPTIREQMLPPLPSPPTRDAVDEPSDNHDINHVMSSIM